MVTINNRRLLADSAETKTADLSLLDFMKQVNLLPGKVGVFDSVEGLDLTGYFRMQCVVLLIVENGRCTIEVNMNQYELKKGGIFLAFPGQIVRTLKISDDLKPLCIACSTDMLNDMMAYFKDSMQLLLLAKKSPYQEREKKDFEQIVKSFKHLQEKMNVLNGNPFYYQIIKNQLLALAFECAGFLTKRISARHVSNRKEALFNAFVRSVEVHHGKEHCVKYYADELFVTPKYLSMVIDEISGKGAKQWIDEYIALDAKVLLQSTQMDIQEISDELNFPDVSFFGKFFKRMTGMSPKAFRMNS